MVKGSFKCLKCDRTFSMPAHLARHTNTMHGVKKAGRPAGRKARRGKRRGPARVAFRAVARTVGGAARVLKEMQSYRQELMVQRNALDAQIAGIEGALDAMGTVPAVTAGRAGAGRRPGRPAGRGARAGSLKETIVKVLRQKGRPMSPNDIAANVVKAGYKTNSKHLTKAVSNTLPDLNEVKKVGRGLYTA